MKMKMKMKLELSTEPPPSTSKGDASKAFWWALFFAILFEISKHIHWVF